MSVVITHGMVLAAGRGERMRPLTDVMPKPMIEVAGRSMINRAIDRLEEAGVAQVVVNVAYKAQMLQGHLAVRSTPSILFSHEETALETGGGIAQAMHHLGAAPFFAVNGDIIWLDAAVPALKRLAEAWNDDVDALLLVHPVETAMGYAGAGDFFCDDKGYLIRRGEHRTAPYVYAGVQILHPRLFEQCPEGKFSLNILYDKALSAHPPRLRAVVHDGQWLHVGDVEGKALAEEYLLGKTS